MAAPSAFFGTTKNSRERGGMLSGSSEASSVASSSVAERDGPSRLQGSRVLTLP